MYILLMVATIVAAFAQLHTGRPLAWAAGGALAALTLTGFVLSRTTGLPPTPALTSATGPSHSAWPRCSWRWR